MASQVTDAAGGEAMTICRGPFLPIEDAGDHTIGVMGHEPAHGFVFDFCGVEVDRDTGVIRIDKYVSLHDAGRILNPALLDGQVRGGFAMAIGAALYERFVYVDDGGFLTGSFADYAVPTASMIPELEILHIESPSPVTPLGAKGVAEGNAMSTPACIANAVADALGVAEISVPLTPERMLELLRRDQAPRRTEFPGAELMPQLCANSGSLQIA